MWDVCGLHTCIRICTLYIRWDSVLGCLVVIVPSVGAGYIFLLVILFNCNSFIFFGPIVRPRGSAVGAPVSFGFGPKALPLAS